MNATDRAIPASRGNIASSGRRALVLLMPVLLAACASAPAPVPDSADAALPVAKVKPMRTLPRDILSEWGTFGIDPARKARRKTGRMVASRSPAPIESPAIRKIVAVETCRDCAQKPFHDIVSQAADTHGVPAALIHAVIEQESRYNPRATSPRKAQGLMQVMPSTARMLGFDDDASLYDPHTNIHAGTAYLRMLMASHDSMEEVLAAYNAGPGNVRRYNGVPPFNETRNYIRAVKQSFRLTSTD